MSSMEMKMRNGLKFKELLFKEMQRMKSTFTVGKEVITVLHNTGGMIYSSASMHDINLLMQKGIAYEGPKCASGERHFFLRPKPQILTNGGDV